MKEHLARLCEIQKLDLEKDTMQDRVDNLEDKIVEQAEILARLDGALVEQKKQLEETALFRTQKQGELTENKDRLKHAEEKFHNVTNTREYAAAEREVESIKILAAQCEEEITQLSKAIDDAEFTIEENTDRVKDLKKGLRKEERAAKKAAKDIAARSNSIDEEVKELGKTIRRSIISRYRFIRERREGLTIVAAVDGACTGCFMRLPPQLYIEIQRAQTLETCPTCQRLLYFPEKKIDG